MQETLPRQEQQNLANDTEFFKKRGWREKGDPGISL